MSSKEEKKASNRDRAIERIAAVVGKYKVIKLSVLVNDTITHVFGDVGKKDEEKASKAYTLVANLVNEMVANDTLSQFTFSKVTIHENATPATISESLIVEGGFNLVGYEPIRVDSEQEDSADHDHDDGGDEGIFNAGSEEDFSTELQRRSSGYVVMNYKEGNAVRDIYVKSSPGEALGKYLSLVGEDYNSPEVFALVPVELEINTVLGSPVELRESNSEEPETALN